MIRTTGMRIIAAAAVLAVAGLTAQAEDLATGGTTSAAVASAQSVTESPAPQGGTAATVATKGTVTPALATEITATAPASSPTGTAGAETTATEGTASPAVMTEGAAPARASMGAGEAEPATGATPTAAAPGQKVLTLQQCIDIALRQNPTVAAASYSVNAAGARVGQARSAYYPQLSLAGSYDKYSLAADPTNGTSTQYNGSATVTQNIFDFGRTPSQVRIQKLNEDAARTDRRNTVSQVEFSVKQAYYTLLQALKNRDVAGDTVKLTKDQLDQAQGYFDAGVKSKYDVTSAEVNLSNAKLAAIKAENAVQIAMVTLKNVMGAPDMPDFPIEDSLAFHKSEITFDDAVKRAYENRPDLLSIESRKEASQEAVSLARTGYYPTLSGNATYGRTDSMFVPQASGWSAGVTLTIPLFNGFLTNNQVKEAKENLNIERAGEESLRQSILLDVQQAYLDLKANEDGVSVAELTVRQSQENYDIVNGRYAAGLGSPLDVTNALVGLANAKTSYIAALANYKIAEAALLKAMGE